MILTDISHSYGYQYPMLFCCQKLRLSQHCHVFRSADFEYAEEIVVRNPTMADEPSTPATQIPALGMQDTNTWAECNPQKPVQETRKWAKLTDTQKNSQKIAAQRNREARIVLSDDITTLVATRKQQIDELAIKHSLTCQHIEKLVDNTSHYKKPRAPNLANAIAHLKGKELNAGMQRCPTSKLFSQ